MSNWSDVYERIRGFPTFESQLLLSSEEVSILEQGISRRDELIKQLLAERVNNNLTGCSSEAERSVWSREGEVS